MFSRRILCTVPKVKRDDVVYICVHMDGSGWWGGGEWIPRNQGISGTYRLLFLPHMTIVDLDPQH